VVHLVQVGFSLERTEQTRQTFLLILGAMLPVGLALAGGGGWLLARRSLKPVDVMTQAAQRISVFQLSERLEESGTGDELDRLARTLNETLERLNQSFNQIRQFSADASHELQTPLTVLKGEIEVALRSSRSADEYRITLQSALEEIDRMARLVEGLLFLARADAGVLKIDWQSVELGQLVGDVRRQLGKMTSERGVELRVELEGRVLVVGDPILLRQMVQNLVQNGLKYTPAGGSVTVSAGQVEDWAELRVSDTGKGLNPEDRQKIFQRFYRSAGARSESGGGAGLGLSIVRSVVQAHQGEIEVVSELGSGSTFTVRLPLIQDSN
jgi:heavy metal sensor kinase